MGGSPEGAGGARVRERGGTLDGELRVLMRWAAAPLIGMDGRQPALGLDRLEEIYRVLSYVARWSEQIEDRVIRLAAV